MTPPHGAFGALIAHALRARPEADAIADGDVRVSYRNMAGIAESLRALCRPLVGDGEALVALEIARSWRAAAAAFGLAASGIAFALIDPALGAERRRAMLDALGPVAVLRWEDGAEPVLDDARFERIAPAAPAKVGRELAYVVFTSGSTGVPKAAAIERDGLAALVRWHTAVYGDARGWIAAQVASASFDAFVWDLFGTLCGGATLRMLHDDELDAHTLWRRLAEVDVAMIPTPLAHMLFAEEAMQPERMRLRDLLTGGDRLAMRPRRSRCYRFSDNYGPTECTVVATSTAALGDARDVADGVVGTALPGQRIVVVDDELCPVADGELGEVVIAGDSVGRGYLNDAAATHHAFLDAPPFAPGQRAYRTGDVGRLVSGGALELHGRRDGQVKIRGYRIELGDVEAALVACEGIADAAAGAVSHRDQRELVAVALARGGAAPDPAALRAELARRLPAYMIPVRIEVVSHVPRTPSGKIDRRRAMDLVS